MIDEELYQKATDELNSDRRRPHLWARACALASDDHDEARYLYTNLRVEELIAERDRSGPATAPDPEVTIDELALEPVAREPEPGDDDLSFADPPSIATVRPGTDVDAHEPLDASPFELVDDSEPRPSSVRTEHRLDLDTLDDLGLDAGDIAAENDHSPTAEPLAGRAREPDAPPDEAIAARVEADVEGVVPHRFDAHDPDGAFDADRAVTSFDTSAVDEIEHTLDRPHDDGGGFAPDENTAIDDAASPRADVALAAGAALARARGDHDRDHDHEHGSVADPTRNAGALDDYASARDVDRLLGEDDDDAPIADFEGKGPVWAVYETGDGRLKAVKRGLSWGAMWLTLPWLLLRGLVGTALVYTLLWAAVAVGLLLTGLAWLDAGAGVDPMIRYACVAFGLLALAGLVIAPLFRANRWRDSRWVRRGYALRGELRARSADDALHRLRALTG